MSEIVLPFLVTYDGREAKRSELDANQLGESITGGAKMYAAIAHYCIFGIVPRGNYRKDFRCVVRPPTPGSWDQVWYVTSVVAGHYALHAQAYNKAITYVFEKAVDAIKDAWTKPKSNDDTVKRMVELLAQRAQSDAELQQILAAGLVRAGEQAHDEKTQLIQGLTDANQKGIIYLTPLAIWTHNLLIGG